MFIYHSISNLSLDEEHLAWSDPSNVSTMKSNLCCKCFSLSYRVLCSLYSPCLLVSQDPFPVQIFQWAALKYGEVFSGVSLGGLQLTIWLCGQHCRAKTTQQAAAAIEPNRPGRKQETGRRRQDILFISVEHDITIASRLNEENLTRGQILCRSTLESPKLKYISIYVLSLNVWFLSHLSPQFAFSALTLTLFSRVLHHPRHQVLPSSEWE